MSHEMLAVSDLRLDPKNPRLPEALRDALQSEIVDFLRQDEALEELAISFAQNGFFESDPLIVVRDDGNLQNVVVEGNRRLATLKILHGLAGSEASAFHDLELPPRRLEELLKVPCFVADSRDSVSKFIGFRHIGGLRLWPPEAKARYVADAIESAADRGVDDPFREVGRQVGSNAQGVRTLYVAISALRFARDEFGIDAGDLQANRFGVWLRALSSPDLRRYIGLTDYRTYAEVRHAVTALRKDQLGEVIRDLTPQPGERRATIADSRMVTDYGRVLASERARSILRETHNFAAARQVVEALSLPDRLDRVLSLCSTIIDDVSEQETLDVTEESVARAAKLATISRSLHRLLVASLDSTRADD